MEILIQIIYIVLFLLGIFLLVYYLINQDWFIKIIINIEKNIMYNYERAKKGYKYFLRSYIYKEDTRFYIWYKKFLIYTKFSVERFIGVKLVLFFIVITVAIVVKTTDIMIYTDELYTKFQYEQDVIMVQTEKIDEKIKPQVIEFKKKCLDEALRLITEQRLKSMDKNSIQDYLVPVIKGLGNNTSISDESLANEVYYKLKKYYEIREWDVALIFLISLAVGFIPELFVLLYNFFIKVDARRELGFMKRLIIMNGSIKPVDFMEVLKDLIKKSTYYTKTLEEIQDKNKKNYLPNTQIYLLYIRASKSLQEKLFFEKLDEANNYDFDQAILNIKNEFNLDKRTQARKIKKTVELIHIFGIVGYMLLIVIVIMYLILPWMSAYKIDALV
ncbi:MAG: hypothetical protein A2Y24_02930 [Clostridiales bacterium GWE2_32_10]|nr:MAG: hypothetical protein A2Y24_02930 [Clostridiales bacterium GWE2_32_10]HBY19549.1 hypothetical protein [Clostridiales bacterium]